MTRAQKAALAEVARGVVQYQCSPKPLRRMFEEVYTSPGGFAKRTFEALYKDGLITYARAPECGSGRIVDVVLTEKAKSEGYC